MSHGLFGPSDEDENWGRSSYQPHSIAAQIALSGYFHRRPHKEDKKHIFYVLLVSFYVPFEAVPRYSYLSASIGLIRLARRAGIQMASIATTLNNTGTPTNTVGSQGLTS